MQPTRTNPFVDDHGLPVHDEMLDDTQTASANVAVEKARAGVDSLGK